METKVRKGREGYEALTEITLPEIVTCSGRMGDREEGVATLRITTGKRSSGGISTFASVVCLRPDRSFSFAIPGDYSKHVGANPVRCTEKSVRALHALVLEKVVEIEAEARAFYAVKETA